MLKFISDVMLKNVVRWLRIANVDTIYAGDFAEDDDEIIKLALKENAILLTKDVKLFEKARNYVKAELLAGNNLDKNLIQVFKTYGIKPNEKKLSEICTNCGGNLQRIEKQKVRERVFPKVFKLNRLFFECTECKKLYWKGSHYSKILKKLETLKERLKSQKTVMNASNSKVFL